MQQFHAPVDGFKEFIMDQITKERKKPWFKNLYKREREEKQHELENRYQKIRRIAKVPTIEFFNDDNILIMILQCLPLDSLLVVRNSCYFFKEFLAKYYQQILSLQKKNLYITVQRVVTDPSKAYAGCSNGTIHYKKVCLISGVETKMVDSQVIEYNSKIKLDVIFKTRQVTDLLSATNQYFQGIFQAIVTEGHVNHRLGILQIDQFYLKTFFDVMGLGLERYHFTNSPFQFWSIFVLTRDDEDHHLQREEMVKNVLSNRVATTPLYAVFYTAKSIDGDVEEMWKHYQSLITDENVHLAFETLCELRFLEKDKNISLSKTEAYKIDGRSNLEREEADDVDHIPLQLLLGVAANIGSYGKDPELVRIVQQYEVAIKHFFPSGKTSQYFDEI